MTAQRDCLDAAAAMIAGRPGPILELGLGNARTYDHLLQLFPDREIFVFDRRVGDGVQPRPDDDPLILGDFSDTLVQAAGRFGRRAMLAHADTGSGDRAATARQSAWLGPALRPLLAEGAIVVSDQPLTADGLAVLAPPRTVPEGRYFMYRAGR